MVFDSDNAAGPSHCKREGCIYKEPAIKWPREEVDKLIPAIEKARKIFKV